MPHAVNFHHYDKKPERLTAEFGDNWLYIGRQNGRFRLAQSPLANPFVSNPKANGKLVDDPIEVYRRWLWGKIVTGDTAVLATFAQMDEATALVCWCKPHDCHGDVVVDAWNYLARGQFEGDGERPSQALSIRQPWAWLIVRPDVVGPRERGRLYLDGTMKVVENRPWRTNFRGSFFIHAAQTIDMAGMAYVQREHPHIHLPSEFETGGIVGQAKLVACVESHGSAWSIPGQKQFVLMEIRPLPFYRCRDRRRFFAFALNKPL